MVDQKPESAKMPLRYTGLLPQEEMLEIGKRQKKLIIGIPKENHEEENRIPLTPEAVEVLVNNGHDVIIESKAGEGAKYSDTDYSERGGFIVDNKQQTLNADIILKVAPLHPTEIKNLKGNQLIISSLQLYNNNGDHIRNLINKKTTAIAYEYIRDEFGRYPVMHSMHAITGNTAIIIAGDLLNNNNGGKGVMLGGISGITPTEVVIIGAGTAAEFAARAALGFGCFVKIFDTSVHKLEQLQQNLGTRLHTSIFHPQVLQRTLKSADVVIGAVNLHDSGPRYFITEEMVTEMKKGSVIIDISIDQGGCIETSEYRTHKNPVFIKHGVIHYCEVNLPSRVARTSSIALSNIISPVLVNIGNSGGIKPFLKANVNVRHGVYLYNGILTNEYVGNILDIPAKDINLLMAAF
ncbi:MAG: alanine dehydrogenase [Bacteroidales bacterium]|nr:alanine dehydrogenase [Bacteroidales bacterium]